VGGGGGGTVAINQNWEKISWHRFWKCIKQEETQAHVFVFK